MARKAVRDDRVVRHELTRALLLVALVEQRVDRLGVGEAGADRLELGGRDAMRDEPQPECVRAPDGAAGEPEIHADLARQPGEDVGDADIREEADGGLGHRERVALAGDTVRAVDRHADAGAHDHAVDQRDRWLGEAFEQPVEPVLLGEGALCAGGVRSAPGDELAHVAARREGARGGRLQDHAIDLRVAREAGEAVRHLGAHVGRQGVERARPVERDDGRRAHRLEADVPSRRGGFGHSGLLCTGRPRGREDGRVPLASPHLAAIHASR